MSHLQLFAHTPEPTQPDDWIAIADAGGDKRGLWTTVLGGAFLIGEDD